jgi:hypothetical protein
MVIEFRWGKATLRPRGEEVDISPSATVALMRDGNQIVAMLGPDIQAGISGFGDTTIEALKDLAAQMECEKYRLEGIDFCVLVEASTDALRKYTAGNASEERQGDADGS